ncbi:MAG: thymidine phosphorylase [Ruminococcus sp.]|nr:thymidine phosphorylase [Ruminococcus sp.]MDY3895613.1 thymidine phosphorylase [Candidatus Fimenecus sp.]
MRMYDIIDNKKHGKELSSDEIKFFVDGFTGGSVPDYQASALLMAVCLKGMSDREISDLTLCMAQSGDMNDMSKIDGVSCDKHSTGGVGDKTSLITAPIAASCGLKVAKMSGRGLGHTGGTVDKLESIPGYNTAVSNDKFFEQVNKIGIALIGQTCNLAPADKKLYALRDVTATVDDRALISASIMSKKLAAGDKNIVLDVKCGSGAFMKTYEDAKKLAETMVNIGKRCGRNIMAVITNMDEPLGRNIGNALEVIEAVDVLRGGGDKDLRELSVTLAANMLSLSFGRDTDECMKEATNALDSGRAFDKFRELVEAQGGDVDYINDTRRFKKDKCIHDIVSPDDGYVFSADTGMIGEAAVILGAGREKKEDIIDPSAGIILYKKVGDKVNKGELTARLFTSSEERAGSAEKLFLNALKISKNPPENKKLIYGIIK